MSGKVLFACSKCFSRHPFEELSSGQQLCKICRGSSSIVKCTYCRSEFHPANKSQSACKKCEHNLSKYGKPNPCECCNIVAAFGGTKCMRCASYEAKYGPPVICDECKQRSAFDKHDENKKINGKLLCWLCTCSFKRALLKAQQEGRISSRKRAAHEKAERETLLLSSKKTKKTLSAVTAGGLDLPEKPSRTTGSGGSGSSGSGNSIAIGLGSIAGPAVISIDPNSADHVVAMTNLKERIASLEKRLQQKDKELLEKDKMLTEIKSKNFEKEIEMRNKLKENDRLHNMKVENLNRKVNSLLKEVASLKKSSKRNGVGSFKDKDKEKEKRGNISPKDDVNDYKDEKSDRDKYDDVDEKDSSDSRSNSPTSN